MRCVICDIRINSVDEPSGTGMDGYFYDGETEHDVACPDCSQTNIQKGKHAELDLKG
jgi:hypothetical protein